MSDATPANSAEQVKAIYENQPYPDPSVNKLSWQLPAPIWISVSGLQGQSLAGFKRILVAGCGRGLEAVSIMRAFPEAEIVGIDFSEKSIEQANQLKERNKLEKLSFQVGDLTNPNLAEELGGGFDFISCHGVISYIEETDAVFQNLAALLNEEGILYVGANGTNHPSVRFREALPYFNEDILSYEEDPIRREKVALLESLKHGGLLSNGPHSWPAGNLRSDLYGPFMLNESLAFWNEHAEKVGLNYLANPNLFLKLRVIPDAKQYRHLLELGPRTLAEMLDAIRPDSFFRLLYAKKAPVTPPWKDFDALRQWRPAIQTWRRDQIPQQSAPWHIVKKFSLSIPGVLNKTDMAANAYMLELFRNADGKKTLGELMDAIPFNPARESFACRLHLYYYGSVVNLLPPQA